MGQKNKGQIAIVGAGALGVMYGSILTRQLGRDRVYFLADENRQDRYRNEGIYCNGTQMEFNYYSPDEVFHAPDLVLIAVKFHQLSKALLEIEQVVSENTIVLSVLNGITSEEILAEKFGNDRVLDCCVQGMDAGKEGNHFQYTKSGSISIGTRTDTQKEKLSMVIELLQEAGLCYKVCEDMKHELWKKLMLNTGVNQVATVFDVPYGGIQKDKMARIMTIEAMKEVKRVAQYEDVFLTDEEIRQWMELIDGMNPEAMPSMRQDMLAGRKTELELFAGTIREKGRQYEVETPVNDYLYEGIQLMERNRGIN